MFGEVEEMTHKLPLNSFLYINYTSYILLHKHISVNGITTFRDLNSALEAILISPKTFRNNWKRRDELLENSTVSSS